MLLKQRAREEFSQESNKGKDGSPWHLGRFLCTNKKGKGCTVRRQSTYALNWYWLVWKYAYCTLSDIFKHVHTQISSLATGLALFCKGEQCRVHFCMLGYYPHHSHSPISLSTLQLTAARDKWVQACHQPYLSEKTKQCNAFLRDAKASGNEPLTSARFYLQKFLMGWWLTFEPSECNIVTFCPDRCLQGSVLAQAVSWVHWEVNDSAPAVRPLP